MAATDTRFRTERFPMSFRRLEVKRIETITPGYVRIVAGGPELEGFQSLDPDDHFKLILPNPGESEPVLPVQTEGGFAYPEDKPRPVMRDYTPRAVDAAARELSIDVALHEDGFASNWARQAKPGDVIGTAGPRGSHIVDYDAFDWFLVAGDETSIPSIARRLEDVPAGKPIFAFIEVDGAADEQPLAHSDGATITWVHRNGVPAGVSTALETAIRAFSFPAGEGYQWYTGETTALREIRRYILNERGFDRQWVSFSGHWKYGQADFDHHQKIED
ncbi:MAG TPA: siderophore-interacting protein [Thermomicrobiales bacterium]|nr:siderophore-interacting protein [Thermomicrobiales bacterium]